MYMPNMQAAERTAIEAVVKAIGSLVTERLRSLPCPNQDCADRATSRAECPCTRYIAAEEAADGQ